MKAVALLSGGIDSPVALYVMAKRMECVALHMDNEPFGGGEAEKAVDMVNRVSEELDRKIDLYVLPFGKTVQKAIYENCEERYRCVICKRMMYKAAEAAGRKIGADIIVTGENLGQVASQTLQNLTVLDESVGMAVVRPLIGLDKEEIIGIARRIGTYDISVKKAFPCGLVPSKPSTSAALEKIHEEEGKADFSSLVERAVVEMVEKL